ncbi:MAG: hypothetical protein GY710_03850 [Desulfobacteraceae bacterium]|nr:hypothetical protein [Desulfobacteraceae bacterium]
MISKYKWIPLFLISNLIILIWFPGWLAADTSKAISISGVVYDAETNNPVDSVEILVFKSSDRKFLKRTQTQKGEYTISLEDPTPDPICIYYRSSDYLWVNIPGLRGNMDQTINKILYREKYASAEILSESLSAIESYHAYAVENNFNTNQLAQKYANLSMAHSAKLLTTGFQSIEGLKVTAIDIKFKAMQNYLKDEGLYNGPVDGLIGEKTLVAVGEWNIKNYDPSSDVKHANWINSGNLLGLESKAAEWMKANPKKAEALMKEKTGVWIKP